MIDGWSGRRQVETGGYCFSFPFFLIAVEVSFFECILVDSLK